MLLLPSLLLELEAPELELALELEASEELGESAGLVSTGASPWGRVSLTQASTSSKAARSASLAFIFKF
jgi:hypothetical protein